VGPCERADLFRCAGQGGGVRGLSGQQRKSSLLGFRVSTVFVFLSGSGFVCLFVWSRRL
jgi:hypothetical protein